MSRKHQGRQHKRLTHRKHLREDDQAMTRHPVGQNAGNRRKEQVRYLARELDESELERGAREAPNQPAHRRDLDPGAGQRDDLSDEESPIILVPQCPDHPGVGFGFGQRRQGSRRRANLLIVARSSTVLKGPAISTGLEPPDVAIRPDPGRDP